MIFFHTELGIKNENRFEMQQVLKALCGSAFSARKKGKGSKTFREKETKAHEKKTNETSCQKSVNS